MQGTSAKGSKKQRQRPSAPSISDFKLEKRWSVTGGSDRRGRLMDGPAQVIDGQKEPAVRRGKLRRNRVNIGFCLPSLCIVIPDERLRVAGWGCVEFALPLTALECTACTFSAFYSSRGTR